MTIESSGAISLGTTAGTNRSISGELGGTEPHSLSEYYRDGSYSDGISISASSTSIPTGNWNGFTYTEEIKFSNFYGVAAPETGNLSNTWFTSLGQLPPFSWANESYSSITNPQAGANLGFQNDQTNDRIAMRYSTFNSGSPQTFSYAYISYTGYATETFRAKCQYNVTAGGFNSSNAENPSSFSPASNTYANISTSSYSPQWQWVAKATSSATTCTLQASSGTSASDDRPYWTVANSTETDTVSGPESTFGSTTTYGASVNLSATYSTQQQPGGPGGPCIHEDMLVSTQYGEQSIHDIKEGSPKIWSWNSSTNEKELVDLLQIYIVENDNLYTVNNLKLTEDHPVYLEGGTRASINPEKTLENYELTVNQLAVDDKIMKEDGTLETITSLEILSGTHVTYTLKTEHNNFYSNGYLVDSEI